MIMGKKEARKWQEFGDIAASGNSVPWGWFGRKLLGKWMRAGLVREVRHWEDSLEVWPNGSTSLWAMGEIVATEKGLKKL